MTEIVTATVSSDGPLQGAEIRISLTPRGYCCVHVDVHLDAIGTHAAQWVPIQDVDQILTDLADAEQSSRRPGVSVQPPSIGLAAQGARPVLAPEPDPLAEVARSHDDRAVARTERRLHDAG